MRSVRRGIFQRKSGKLPIGAYRAAVLCEQVSRPSRCEVFSLQFSAGAGGFGRYTNGSTTMAKKRCTGKALAERRRRTFQLYLAEFTQEQIAEKVGVHRSVVCRDLQSFRETWRSGDSPDLEEARFTQMAKNEVQPARIGVRPDTPADGRNAQPRGGGSILGRKEDLLPYCRWILAPTEVVVCSAQLCTSFHMPTQANTIPAHADTSPDMPAHTCTTLVPPSQKRKPLCDSYLYRWIRPSFPFRGGRQAGWDEYRQGIEGKRLPHSASLPRRATLPQKQPPATMSNRQRCHG